jgi:hypothetical protein
MLEHSYYTLHIFPQMGSKKPTFSCLAKALLHQTPYFNFTIPFFNISLLLLLFFLIYYYYYYYYFFFSQLPKYYTTKKHYYTKKKSFLFPQMMNSSSLVWASYCSLIAHFQWFVEADGLSFCCLLLILCCFRPIVHSNANALTICTVS